MVLLAVDKFLEKASQGFPWQLPSYQIRHSKHDYHRFKIKICLFLKNNFFWSHCSYYIVLPSNEHKYDSLNQSRMELFVILLTFTILYLNLMSDTIIRHVLVHVHVNCPSSLTPVITAIKSSA